MKFDYFRNFGTLSNSSVATDIYNKRIPARKKKQMSIAKAKKCVTRIATEEEKEKYNIRSIGNEIQA